MFVTPQQRVARSGAWTSRKTESRTFRPAAARVLGALFVTLLVIGCGSSGRDRAASVAHQRIVVMAPAAAEMLHALGVSDRIVGVGDFVTEPADLGSLPRIGAYNAPNVERVLELEPDLFLSSASEAASTAHARLESLGVRVVALDTSTYDGVLASLDRLGRLIDRPDAAARLRGDLQARLDAITTRAAGCRRRRVLFVVGRDPLYVAGPGSHIDQMIAMAGGVNVAHDAPSPYHRVSLEAVLERMPEVIIDTSDNGPEAPRGAFAGSWGQWDFLPAVRQGRVFWVDPSRLVIPGIRLAEMTALTARLIQPETFGPARPEELTAP